jgi:hypothetical protein
MVFPGKGQWRPRRSSAGSALRRWGCPQAAQRVKAEVADLPGLAAARDDLRASAADPGGLLHLSGSRSLADAGKSLADDSCFVEAALSAALAAWCSAVLSQTGSRLGCVSFRGSGPGPARCRLGFRCGASSKKEL